MSAAPERWRFTVEQYHQMGKAGVLHEDDRVELIAGEIVKMAAIGSRHSGCVARLDDKLGAQLRGRAIIWVQNPVEIEPDGEPEADVAVLRYREDYYSERHPLPGDVLLVIEVADTTVVYDRNVKLPLYAAAGIPDAWLVDLPGRRIEVHREPRDGRYQRVVVVERGALPRPAGLPGLSLGAEDVLGPPPS